ncbi:nocobactin polyketide synthase NbtC [Nocardia vermiculata]|uniref:Nocobactin polyketide synthase NbtC n=1 Tax=Nocardia vermiculata TaxID=257274 RepID=A0A846XWK0_9NOCA|nr:nocobactin polyketide synthase NbtC [Nocardia vermiculata]
MSEYRLPDGTVPVLVSSDSPAVLGREAATLLTYLGDHPEVTPERVADMLFRTRAPRRHRALAMAGTRAELITALQAVAEDRTHPAVIRPEVPATARRPGFVFPGQGGQRPGMGRLFYDRVPAFRDEIDRCTALFEEFFGESPRAYLLDSDSADADGADDTARIVQPALFTQMAGLAAMWRAAGIGPELVVGHSQGEIAAAYVSGAMTLADAVLVVGTRARAVDTISSDRYAMAVAAASREECERLLARNSGWAQVSVINSPGLVGISGERHTVCEVVDTLTGRDRFARLIRVGYPAHTDRVAEFRTELQDAVRGRLANQQFLESEIPCLGATLGDVIIPDLPVDEYWFWNLRNPVRFDLAIEAALAREVDTFVELADHPTLALSVQENITVAGAAATVTATSVRTAADLSEFTRNLANLAVADLRYEWDALRIDTAPPTLPLPDFPNTGMNEQRLWLPYNDSAASAPALTARRTPVASEPVRELTTAGPQVVVEQWQRPQRRSLSAPCTLAVVDHTGACAELAAALCDEAENQGAVARRIDVASRPDTGDADTVVVLLPGKAGPDAVGEVARFFGEREWWFDAATEVKQWWLVTVGAESVLAQDPPPEPVPAAVAAGFRCLGGEYPGIAFRHLDLPAGAGGAADAAAVVTALHTAREPELALRDGATYVKRLVEPAPAQSVEVPSHVLIIGGTGGVGLEYCRHFAEAGAHRITLVSRSGAGAAADRIAAIGAASGTDIRVVAHDVGEVASVAALADELRATPVDFVLHAAADIAELTNVELTEVTPDRVERALRGKVTGITAVLTALTLSEQCRVLLCSSLAASIGGRGMAVYAAANRMLDAMAYRLRADGIRAVSIQWGWWSTHRGAGTSEATVLERVGYRPMPPDPAITLSLTELPANAIIAAFDWERGRSVLGQFGYGPLLTDLRTPELDGDIEPEPQRGAADSAPAPDRVLRILTDVIGADDPAGIDTAAPLVAVGLDSLQALEMRRRVDEEFHYELPVADLIGGASLDDVLRMLGAGPSPVGAGSPAAAPERAHRRPAGGGW